MVDVVPWQVELEDLRACCYRPEASVATVEAYLATRARLQAEHPARQDRAPAATSPRRVREAVRLPGLRIALGAAVVALAAAAVGMQAALPASHAAPLARPSSSDALDAVDALPPGGALLGTMTSEGARTTGALEAGGRTVVLTSACRGVGTYDVRIGDAPATTLVCDHEGPSFAMLTSGHPLGRFAVTVSAPDGATSWVVAIGTLDDAGLRSP